MPKYYRVVPASQQVTRAPYTGNRCQTHLDVRSTVAAPVGQESTGTGTLRNPVPSRDLPMAAVYIRGTRQRPIGNWGDWVSTTTGSVLV